MRTRRRLVEAANGFGFTSPLIDVVFLLLIFFLLTITPVDILAKLDTLQPSPAPGLPRPVVKIRVLADGLTIGLSGTDADKHVDLAELEKLLATLAAASRNQTIMVWCAPRSTHGVLVSVLDLCAKAGFEDVALVSTRR
ncbi:MAG: biopolymer transporter ExbD [Kiritimatiellae bacterium]|nr:biopolymer transporter ExbD [Kiritimatiellia bacterium]